MIAVRRDVDRHCDRINPSGAFFGLTVTKIAALLFLGRSTGQRCGVPQPWARRPCYWRLALKVLVTGSDGYIGTVLCPYLMDRGFDVVGLDTGFHRIGWLYNGVRKMPATMTKDTRNVTEADLAGFDAVVHLADLSNDPVGHLNPKITFDINHKGTMHLAAKAKAAGVKRFVYSSSCSVYGASVE